MSPAFWALALCAADSLVGVVRVVGPAQSRAVLLRLQGRDITLTGELTEEIGRVASARIEVTGVRKSADTFEIEQYHLLGVGGNASPPWVGNLLVNSGQSNQALALDEGAGKPIVLNVSSAARSRLLPQGGAKIWVYGKKLLSGELQVQVFGILRPKRAVVEAVKP